MTRVTSGPATRKRHKKIIKMAKGFRGRSKNCFRVAVQSVEKSLQYAYRDRRNRKRDLRRLWIARINAAVREHGLIYSSFINGLTLAGVEVNRKMLSELAISEPNTFKQFVDVAQKELNKKAA